MEDAQRLVPDLTFERFYAPALERGAALSVCADLDAAMGACLRKALVEHETVHQMLTPQGMLGGLGSRLRMIFALGLIKTETYAELTKILKVRNQFAHYPDVEAFDHPKVQGLVSSILALRDIRLLKPYQDYAFPLKASITLLIKGDEATRTVESEGPVRTSMVLWDATIADMISKGFDVNQPRWAYCFEASIFYSCFSRLVKEPQFRTHHCWF